MSKKATLATWIGLAVVTLVPSFARADQCDFVSKQQADDAMQLVEKGATIVSFCEPCGDAAPQSVLVTSVSEAATGFEDTYEVSVNGSGIDMAYTFIENGDGNYVNLSKMVDCPSTGVTCMLDEHLARLPQTCDDDKEDNLGGGPDSSAGCAIAVGDHGASTLASLLFLSGLIALVARRRRSSR